MHGSDDKSVRLNSIDLIKGHIKDAQQTAIAEQHLRRFFVLFGLFVMTYPISVHPGESTQMDLWTAESKEPKYTLTIVDQAKGKAKNGQFAIFIVPHGR